MSRDIDRTVAWLRRLGLGEMQVRRDLATSEEFGTVRHAAKVWIGPVMLEVIEPLIDRPPLHVAPPPEEQEAYLHHLGCAVADEADWRARCGGLERRRLDVPVSSGRPGELRFSYTDLRAETGLFLKHVHLLDKGFHDKVPRSAPGGLLDGFFQIAFVTRDLEAAMERLGERFGVARFSVAPGVAGTSVRRVAIARPEGVMIEIVEPEPGLDSSYSALLPRSGLAAVHHLGFHARLDAIEGLLAERGIPIARRNETPVSRSLHADTRRELGHFLEYVELRDAG